MDVILMRWGKCRFWQHIMRWSNISVLSVAGKEGWETALDDLLMRSARLLLSRPLSFPSAPCPSFFSFLLLFPCFFWALFPVFGTILTLSFSFSLFSSLASTLFSSFSCPFLSSSYFTFAFIPSGLPSSACLFSVFEFKFYLKKFPVVPLSSCTSPTIVTTLLLSLSSSVSLFLWSRFLLFHSPCPCHFSMPFLRR